MQSLVALTQTDSESNSIDIIGQLRHSLAFQISDSEEVLMIVAGALSHQIIRILSANIEGIAAYKGLDMIADCYQSSDGMYQMQAKSALT